MNKYQEMYKHIADNQYQYGTDEDWDLFKELVERATPKKPIILLMKGFEEEAASHMCCPNCKQPIVNVWSKAEYKPKYCHYCSQALDWSEENEE